LKNEIIFYIEESIDGGFEAKALGFSIFTEGDTIDELKENIRDAVQCHFDEQDLPHVIKLHFVREEAIAL
jgi:predicted RNase H-like HicB family nuclease